MFPSLNQTKRILELALAHFGAPRDLSAFRLGIKLLPGMSVGSMSARAGGPLTACGRLLGIPPGHGRRTFSPAMRADVRPAFALLLCGASGRFLLFGAAQVALVAPSAFIFGTAGFLERDRDGLAAALDLARFAARTALEFAMAELVHDPAGNPPLARRC